MLAAAFKAGDYLNCVKNLRTLNINPMSHINRLDEVSSYLIGWRCADSKGVPSQMTDSLPSDSDLWKQCIRELNRACRTYWILPASHEITLALVEPQGKPFKSNDLSSIWKFIGDKDHKQVFAIKSFQVSDFHSVEEFNMTWFNI